MIPLRATDLHEIRIELAQVLLEEEADDDDDDQWM